MKILVLTSRYTASRDIVEEKFGRQVRLFENIASGNPVDFYCLDYKKLEKKDTYIGAIRVFVRPFGIKNLLSFLIDLEKKIKREKYDLIVAASDPLWGIIGYIYARLHSIPLAYDIQDNYETYKSYKIPFVPLLDKKVIRNAELVIAASNYLEKEAMKLRSKKNIMIPNGADLELFKPMDKIEARKKLSLPLDAKIISYIGTFQKLYGTDILVEEFIRLKNEIEDLKLLLAGKFSPVFNEENEINLKQDGIIYLGSIPQSKVVYAINASDVMVLPYPKNNFTEAIYASYKVVEFMACNRPIVATDAGEISKMIGSSVGSSELICKAGSGDDLREKIKLALTIKSIDYRKRLKEFSWKSLSKRLEEGLRSVVVGSNK